MQGAWRPNLPVYQYVATGPFQSIHFLRAVGKKLETLLLLLPCRKSVFRRTRFDPLTDRSIITKSSILRPKKRPSRVQKDYTGLTACPLKIVPGMCMPKEALTCPPRYVSRFDPSTDRPDTNSVLRLKEALTRQKRVSRVDTLNYRPYTKSSMLRQKEALKPTKKKSRGWPFDSPPPPTLKLVCWRQNRRQCAQKDQCYIFIIDAVQEELGTTKKKPDHVLRNPNKLPSITNSQSISLRVYSLLN